jgi:ABC-2 type transport system permease protein
MTAVRGRSHPVSLTRLVAIVVYTLRSCIGRKRWLGCLLPCVGALLFGLLAHAITGRPTSAYARVAADGIFALVVPITSLVIGDAVLGSEVRSGVFHFTFLSPAPLIEIVVGRWIGGAIVALCTLVPACALSAYIADVPQDAWAVSIAAFIGSLAYIAVFIAFGAIARRAAVWSLAAVFLVERLLGAALTGIAQWSPTWESRAVFLDFAERTPNYLVREGIPSGGGAIVRLLIVSAIGLFVAQWRMRRIRISGASD